MNASTLSLTNSAQARSRRATPLLTAWLGAVLAIALSSFHPTLATAAGPWLFMASIVLMGMPHGMIDAFLLINPKKGGNLPSLPNRRYLLAAYALIFIIAAAIIWLFPVAGFLLFLAATAFHWGCADFGATFKPLWLWHALGLTRGTGFLTALFSCHFSESCTLAFGFTPAFPTQLLPPFALATGILHLALLAISPVHANGKIIMSADFLFSIALVTLAPPLVGISIYYMAFHSARYFMWFDSPKPSRRIMKMHVAAALAFLPILACLLPSLTGATLHNTLHHYVHWHLQLLAALTIPHLFLAYYFQRRTPPHVSPDKGSPLHLLSTKETP